MKRLLRPLFLIALFALNLSVFAQDEDWILFETPSDKIIIEATPGNIWQIGTSDKQFLGVGHNGPNVIITDTIMPYPVNNRSSFIYVIDSLYTLGCATTLDFWHKYDIADGDYGELEASYDGGNSWVTINDTIVNPTSMIFWWEWDFHEATLSYNPHPLMISGTSDGWVKSTFHWQWYIGVKGSDTIIMNPNTLLVRFTFNSDSQAEDREGWMIDALHIYAEYYYGCGSANNREIENNIEVYPNPFSTGATVRMVKPLSNGTISVYNSQGELVLNIANIAGQTLLLPTETLKPGFYLLKISEGGKVIGSKRVIKK